MNSVGKDELEALKNSGLFDERYYLEQYPDVKLLGMSALEHYLWIGKKLGRRIADTGKGGQLHSSNIVVTECHGIGDGLPDLFSLRAKPCTASKCVVAYAENYAQLSSLRSTLGSSEFEFDLILTVPKTLSETCKSVIDHANYSLVAYPEQLGPAHALIHIVNSGALSQYQSICWIDASIGLDHSGSKRLLSAWRKSGSKVGLLAAEYKAAPDGHGSAVAAAAGTFLARLGRKRPGLMPDAPSGSLIVIAALLIHQLRAYGIRPSELGKPAAARWSISNLLSIICDEAGLQKSSGNEPGTSAVSLPERRMRPIAFYLPQFHPIAENDQWWGKGFTEWTNVVNARPVFRSHFQPNLPADLGFYDLRTPETQEAQAKLAREYGVGGFCYYYYWFNGRKLLNQPIEQMLQTGKPDFPFCVCWANENWSRNWDGQNKHVLIEQSYSLESNRALIREFISMMKDPRYIRHNGKPVVLVYRIRVIPNWLETARMWREECRRAGIGEIHLCAVRFGLEPLDGPPAEFGVDSYVLFPPHESDKVDVKQEMLDLAPDFNGTIFSYDSVVDGDIRRFESGYPWPVHRGAMLGWDNTARRPRDSRIFVGATPARFHHWLQEIVRQEECYNADDESLIFINAWNEWAEGTTLEPSTRFGRGYLQAVRSALGGAGQPQPGAESSSRASKPLPTAPKWYDGAIAHLRGAPTILVCAHVVSDRIFGGERSFLDVLEALSRLGLNIIVALPSDKHAQYRKMTKKFAAKVVVIPYKQWRNNRDPDQDIVSSFCQVMRSESIDLVYANTIVLLEPLIAAKEEKKKTVVHARELINTDDELCEQIGLSSEQIIRTVSDRADYIIGNSQTTVDLFHREGTVFYAPNVVDPEQLDISNKFGNLIKFGIISSNIPKKGITDFIEIARSCETSCPRARFVVIGPENDYIERLRADSLPKNLVFAGYASSPTEAMSMINVVLSLSHVAESFGRTIAEAQAARRPVIAYHHGAVGELVEDGVTGLLVQPFDVGAATAAVKRFCAESRLIREMGEAGRSRIAASYSSPTLLGNLWRAFQTMLNRPISMRADAPLRTTIIVPIFNAWDEVRNCLASLERHVDFRNDRVLMINDGSTDPRIAELLQAYGSRKGFHLLTNKSNIGYTRTINIGIRWAGDDDVLLLNSDTVVTAGFLEGLRRTATSDAAIGTVTAMSDNAGAFSFPQFNQPNPKPADVSHDDHAAAILRRTAACAAVEVPTGSGFCMYIRRSLFDAIGLFDEEAFPRGYGEENDFCMRALNSGWRNLICPHAYVFHVRTASFGSEKESLTKEAIEKVTRRHPDYAERVKRAFASTEMQALRTAAQI